MSSIYISCSPAINYNIIQYINLFDLNHNGNIKQILGRSCLSLASHYLILSLTYYIQLQLSILCLNLFLLAMLSIVLFAFIFLLLFYSKIGLSLSLLLNQIVWPYRIFLYSVCMCGILKFKLTIENCYTINCIIHCKIRVCAFSVQLLASYLESQTGQSLTSCLLQLKFPRSMLKISPIMLVLCFPAPIMPNIMLA